jgi:hypothetical protein
METLQESVDNMLIRHEYNSTSDKLYRSFEVNYLTIHSIILTICLLLPLIIGYFDELYLIISLWVAFFILCASLFSWSGKIDSSFIQIRSNLEYLKQIVRTKQDWLSILEFPILFDRIEDTNNLIDYIESNYLFHIINKMYQSTRLCRKLSRKILEVVRIIYRRGFVPKVSQIFG